MALAEYHDRGALAAAQVIAGFDPNAFQGVLEATPIGLSLDQQAATTHEGRALLDLAVRLLARLYPTLELRANGVADNHAADLADLAVAINPRITIGTRATVGIAVGPTAPLFDQTIFAGSRAWEARVSTSTRQNVSDSPMPFGAGAAACLAAGALFRRVLMGHSPAADAVFSCLDGVQPIAEPNIPAEGWILPEPAVLVGLGAIGQAAAWALARSPLCGDIFLVDGETIDLSNLQRYVLATRANEGAEKTALAADHLTDHLTPYPYYGEWARFTTEHGYHWPTVLTAVDSATDRFLIQAALPRWIGNAWTQPGDLGVSTHPFTQGACLACLYLPTGAAPNEDDIVARALGVPTRAAEIRTLLHNDAPPPHDLLNAIAVGLAIPRHDLSSFEGLPIRSLYVKGVCGGDVLPLGSVGIPRQELHVPLAHQSALAGVLLAARLARRAAGLDIGRTEVIRINILTDLAEQLNQPAQKDPRGICMCQDGDYKAAYDKKWGTS